MAGADLLGIPLYVALIGFLNAQYTLTGYDASAHMSEETHDAPQSAPRGIVFSVVVSVIMGFILLSAMNYGIKPDKVFTAADGTANGAPATSTRWTRRDAVECRPADHDLDRRGRPDRSA